MSQERNDSITMSSSREGSLQAHSCMLCKQRKVKCDKKYPCTQCSRAKVQCIFRAPAPPRRGKRKPSEVNLLARLKRYEDMLQALGVTVDSVNAEEDKEDQDNVARFIPPFGRDSSAAKRETPANRGKLVAGEEGKSIYFENMLWKSLSDELRDPNELLHASSDEDEDEEDGSSPYNYDWQGTDILFSPGKTSSIKIPHPLPSQVLRLWQAFTSNVNPLCKIIHEPTTYATILEASADLAHVPKNLEALLFAIYAISVSTLEPEECESLLGEKRSHLIERYTLATRLAFQRAGLLRSADLMLVQAFALHLFLLRTRVDSRILWIYTGIATRLSQRIGLHRDGTKLDIGPFETEMRRRLWWQVIVLDTHASMLSGTAAGLATDTWDTQLPVNVNDNQLWPEMTEPPVEQEGATDMFFCMVRFEFSKVFRMPSSDKDKGEKDARGFAAGAKIGMAGLPPDTLRLEMSEKDRRIDEAEKRIGDKFLRHVDAFNDLHVLSLGVVRTALSSMRLMVHHPRQYPDGGASLTQEEKEVLFSSAARILEYDCNAHSSPNLRRFRWHFAAFFQANAFVLLLSELCDRTSGNEVESAWRLVEECYRHHAEILEDQKWPIHVALGNLTLRAWGAREAAHGPLKRPDYIERLLTRRPTASAKSRSQGASPASSGQTQSQGQTPLSPPGPSQQQQQQQQYAQQQQKLQQGIQTLDLSQSNPVSDSLASTYPFNPVFSTDVNPTLADMPSSSFTSPLSSGATPSTSCAAAAATPATTVSGGSGSMGNSRAGGAMGGAAAGLGAEPLAAASATAKGVGSGLDSWMGAEGDILDVGTEPMDWAAWDDLIADSRLEGYALEAPMGFGFGGQV